MAGSQLIDHVETMENGVQCVVLTEEGRKALTVRPKKPQRPKRSRWQKWWLCRERVRQRWRESGDALPIYVQAGKDAYAKYNALCRQGYTHAEAVAHGEVVFRDALFEQWRTRYHARKKASERYRRMLWGRKPFGNSS